MMSACETDVLEEHSSGVEWEAARSRLGQQPFMRTPPRGGSEGGVLNPRP
jgi:hypothetical protein